jgi:hypothetical protein
LIVNWTVGVYGVPGGSGRGPWIEVTSRVAGEEVSTYADPGAVVTRLVRRTFIREAQKKEYRFSEALVMDDDVSRSERQPKAWYKMTMVARDTTILVQGFAVCLRPLSFLLQDRAAIKRKFQGFSNPKRQP